MLQRLRDFAYAQAWALRLCAPEACLQRLLLRVRQPPGIGTANRVGGFPEREDEPRVGALLLFGHGSPRASIH